MFFILSKILLVLIQPLFWVFVLLIWAVITKNSRKKKRLLYTTLGVLYFFSNTFILKCVINWWDIPTQDTGNKTLSCAIVLGGFTSIDANGQGHFNGASTRFIETLKILATNKASKVLITGGSGLLLKGHNIMEADFTVEQMHLLKIPDSVILTENKSRNTLENALFSKKILNDKKIPGPYLLVTSAFHMRRSMLTFKKAGLDVIPYASDYVADKSAFSITDAVPNANALVEWNVYAKEMIGYITYYFKKF